jgi:DNA invertase Pin-like site-specific DNA recombinase
MTKTFIGVCRVSTRSQSITKNGLDSQRAEIERWALHHGYNLVTIMDEVISGSTPMKDRPVMSMALAMAKKMKAQVVVTKSDRFSRDFDISREYIQKKKQVIAIDLGAEHDEFVGTIFAGLAEKERKMIGLRTKAGLAAAKARGVILGNRTNLPEAREKAAVMVKAKADRFAAHVRPPIERMKNCGMTYAEIAEEMNALGVPTARGGDWSAASICRVISRWN